MLRTNHSNKSSFISLELKCLLIFGTFLVFVIFTSYGFYWYFTESILAQRNPDTAKLLVEQALLVKHWTKLEPKEGFSWVVNDLTERLSKMDYEREFISLDTPVEQLDEYEREILQQYHEHPENPLKPVGKLIGDTYHYYSPVVAQEACLVMCHNQIASLSAAGDAGADGAYVSPLKVGSLMSILRVTIPNGPTQRALNWSWNILVAVALITTFLGMLAFYVTIRYVIVRPLRHLREVSTAIGHGNMALRADIHTGDEFETLGIAFNRMLRGLVNTQLELRRANQNLDAKIGELGHVNLQLRELNRIKSDFLATMSHELRTPLNSILGFSDVLATIEILDDRQRRYVQNIQRSGRMLLNMINDILDLAKIESGRMEIKPCDFSVEHVIISQCDLARPLAEKKNITLSCEMRTSRTGTPDAHFPLVHLDQNRVQQILNNLISNAIKFTPEGGGVTVTGFPESSGSGTFSSVSGIPSEVTSELTSNVMDTLDVNTAILVIQVADTGVGIAPEDRQKIFEKFRQGGSAMGGGDTMTREYSGTGLGLSIVKELCKLMKGEVTVDSIPGAGSTFTVKLPWRIEDQARKEDEFSMLDNLGDFSRLRGGV